VKIKVDANLFFRFPVDSHTEVCVFRVLPATGKSHVTRPGVLWVMGAVNEEHL
jgi:hypothetical protein